MSIRYQRLAAVAAFGLAVGMTVGANGASARQGEKIALLLPESQTTRYEQHDRPLFEAKVKALCPTCGDSL